LQQKVNDKKHKNNKEKKKEVGRKNR